MIGYGRVTATDTADVKAVLEAVSDIILRGNIEAAVRLPFLHFFITSSLAYI